MKCVCGFEGNNSHGKMCSIYKDEINRIGILLESYIAKYYLSTYSITDCCVHVKNKENTKLSLSKLRTMIDKFLTKENIKVGLDNKALNDHRQKKMKRTMMTKYGVTNAGQMEDNGWGSQNKIQYSKMPFDSKLAEYKKRVSRLGRVFKESLSVLPTKCEYTNIAFNDNSGPTNPNDPFKRTLDHKMPVIECYFRGLSPEECAAENNVVFCLRIINTLKGNTTYNSFNELLPYIRKQILNEN